MYNVIKFKQYARVKYPGFILNECLSGAKLTLNSDLYVMH